nr:hypothetical protein CFP56_42705 [Quercus suber]
MIVITKGRLLHLTTLLTKMVESGMYATRPEIEFSGFSSSHQTEEEQLDFLEINQAGYDPGLPFCPFYKLPVFPSTLAELNDFKEEIPAIFLEYELPPRNSSKTDEGWVVRKFLGEDYESHLSKYFKLCFSELFLHSDGLERYYMFQFYHPVFYNDGDKYKLVHVLVDLRKRDVLYFTQFFGLHDPKYSYHCWWSSLAKENDESMLGGVYLYKDNKIAVYDDNSNSLPIFLRNCHEHYTGGTETKNRRIIERKQQIGKENGENQIKNKKVQQRMRHCGQQANLQLELKLTPIIQNIRPDQLPFHCELEPKITESFPGIYACLIDSCIQGFNDHGERRFGCTLAQLLFDKSPFGCQQQQQQVGYIGAATLQTQIAP